MKTKVKLYIAAVVVALVVVALVYNTYFANLNAPLSSYDGRAVDVGTYLQLRSIASNQTLANIVGSGVIPTSSYPVYISGNLLVLNGKPGVLYVGAEYCPFCAAGRWGLLLALMRFGDFSTLHYMTSSASDIFGSTPTFTFYNSTYNSSYISFDSAETQTNTYTPLQQLNPEENITFHTYDTSGIPFMDFGNKSIQSGSDFSPGIIWSPHYNWQQIIALLSQPNSTASQAIIGSADVLTAQICQEDNFTPTDVCSAHYIKPILAAMH